MWRWFSNFFERVFVSLVNRLICIRNERLLRSTCDVLAVSRPGLPVILSLRAPILTACLWRASVFGASPYSFTSMA